MLTLLTFSTPLSLHDRMSYPTIFWLSNQFNVKITKKKIKKINNTNDANIYIYIYTYHGNAFAPHINFGLPITKTVKICYFFNKKKFRSYKDGPDHFILKI